MFVFCSTKHTLTGELHFSAKHPSIAILQNEIFFSKSKMKYFRNGFVLWRGIIIA